MSCPVCDDVNVPGRNVQLRAAVLDGNCGLCGNDRADGPANRIAACMRPVSARTTIDAPRERVFELLCDLSRRPAFTDHFLTEYRLGRVDPVGEGASARFRLRESGIWLDTVIEKAERPHLVREHGRGGRSNRVPTFTVWELAEGPSSRSCEVTVTFWTEPTKAIDRARELFGPWRTLRRGWQRALARLRRLLEDDAPVPRVAVAGGDRLPTFNR
jgi:uncharacterized protein YndB with AHSA1/START domain